MHPIPRIVQQWQSGESLFLRNNDLINRLAFNQLIVFHNNSPINTMRKKILLSFFMLLVCFIGSSYSNSVEPREYKQAFCWLRNPPDSSVEWSFLADQAIMVYLENCNLIGVTVTLSEDFAGSTQYEHYIIGPYGVTNGKRYSIFGQTPISWKFTLSTASDVALVRGRARWDNIQ